MTLPIDVGPSVESCLAQAWEFMTGAPMLFEQVDTVIDFAEPSLSFILSLSPIGANWAAGTILSLTGGAIADANQSGGEICNVFSGCVTRLFARREEFEAGLPVCIPHGRVTQLVEGTRTLQRYLNKRRDVLLLVFEAEASLTIDPAYPCNLLSLK